MFDFAAAPLPIREDLADAFRHVWKRLASPGTWWAGAERVAIAAVARAAYASADIPPVDLPEPAIEAAALLGQRPSAVTRSHVADWGERGLDPYRYVELIGVVSQVTTVDTFHRGLAMNLEPLPVPSAGEPSHEEPASPVSVTKAWVPMIGPPNIPITLSAVPAEMAALEHLSGFAYMTYEEMQNPAFQRGLSRAQMELVASRTSAINECFY
ncbi:MAG: hypothetical protein QNJ75_09285 [Acidimicrobiia bacterium]|nr:hypothetical protein [Acidimicrobiia bacterium]